MRYGAMNDGLSARVAILRIVLAATTLLTPVLATTASAQERWAALSLLGDRMNLIYARTSAGTTGGSTNPNRVVAVPTKDDVLDRLVLRAVLNANPPGNPEIVPLALRDPRFYQAQDKLFDGESKPLLDSVRKALEAQNVTHLLVVARSRGEAAFPVEQGHIGIGSVEGLGYYIDKVTQIKNTDVGMSDRGYLAPFTYYRLMLFEFARAAVVGEERVAASMLHPIAGSGETDPWELVSSQQKFDDIDVLLKKHMGAALARLRARARP